MAMAFAQSMRALAADRGRWSLASLIVVLVLLGGWGAWFVLARVAIYEVTRTARLEVDQAVHPIATPVAGRVVATYLVVGRDVQAGEVLIELDAAAFRLQHDEARLWSTALTAQRQARHQELVAEQAAQQDERPPARPWPRRAPGSMRPRWHSRRQPRRPTSSPACRPMGSHPSSTCCARVLRRTTNAPPPTPCAWRSAVWSVSSGPKTATAPPGSHNSTVNSPGSTAISAPRRRRWP